MSYQVLARKWRPKRFSEMVGQQHVLKALENALNQDRLHHAYLFTGTRGVGKTTIARIFAKCLNCNAGVSAEPCGQCSNCLAIDKGNFLDLIEIDAASKTKVEEMRDLLENVQYSPTTGRYKVYLIDEVHMLSGHSFNALLKTLEEPPPHVKFLLATTDPQKLPVTVLSRCLQFNLKAMSAAQIAGHLNVLLEKEMIPFEDDALVLLAKAAEGSMRDALSLTDQAIAHGNEKLLTDEVRNMLGLIDEAYVLALLTALLERSADAMLDVIEQMAQDAPDYRAVLAALISQLHRLVLAQIRKQDDDERLLQMAAAFTPEELQLYYQIALKGRQDLALAPDARQGMEMTMLRMLLFNPVSSIKVSAPAAANAEKDPVSALKEQLEKKKPELRSQHPVAINAQEQKTIKSAAKQPDNDYQTHNELSEKKPEEMTAALPNPLSYQHIDDRWTQIVLRLDLEGPALMIARNANFRKTGENSAVLTVDKHHQLFATHAVKLLLNEKLNQLFGKTITLEIQLSNPEQPTPALLFQLVDVQKEKAAIERVMSEEAVKTLVDEFGAEIIDGSARLVS